MDVDHTHYPRNGLSEPRNQRCCGWVGSGLRLSSTLANTGVYGLYYAYTTVLYCIVFFLITHGIQSVYCIKLYLYGITEAVLYTATLFPTLLRREVSLWTGILITKFDFICILRLWEKENPNCLLLSLPASSSLIRH